MRVLFLSIVVLGGIAMSDPASSITLNFDPATGRNVVVTAVIDPNFSSEKVKEYRGTWEETGFSVEWGYAPEDDYPDYFIRELGYPRRVTDWDNFEINMDDFSGFTSFRYTTDCYICTPFDEAEIGVISRSDGKSFSLSSLEVSSSTSHIFFIETYSDSHSVTQSHELSLIYDRINLRGTKLDGTVVEVLLPHQGETAQNVVLTADQKNKLSDLTSLEIIAHSLEEGNESLQNWLFRTFASSNLDPALKAFVQDECRFPEVFDLGDFDCYGRTDEGYISAGFRWGGNGQNVGTYVEVDSLTFIDPSNPPAPVPLPASGLLLGASLVAFLRYRKQHSVSTNVS